jgi:S-formylglutathione hydrolase FrmB
MKNVLLFSIAVIITHTCVASIDTVSIYSNVMFKNVKCVIVTPGNYKTKQTKYPVVYLLHGYGGDYSNWVNKVPEMQQLADDNQVLIVCPDGAFGSWYFDSPVDLNSRYETNVSIEIPRYIDSLYQTIANRNGRAITGLSMGGHGAMFIALRHAETFGACGSMSGALSVITKGYNIEKILGDTIVNNQYYRDWVVFNMVEKMPAQPLSIIMDCGTEDYIYPMTKRTHDRMMQLKIPHDYIERPGKHDWAYWRNSIPYQLMFFKKYFLKGKD